MDRRQWLFPPTPGLFGSVDVTNLDLDSEDDRRLLIEAEHPELASALGDGLDEVVLDGEAMNPQLHLGIHQLVATQLWEGVPPETWETVQRLVDYGCDRHEVLHMVGGVAAMEAWRASRYGEPFDGDRYLAGLQALPESWEDALDDELDDFDDEDEYDDDDDDDELELFGPTIAPLPEGITLTHRLSVAESAGEFVTLGADLVPLEGLLGDGGHLRLVGGAVAEPTLLDDDTEVLVGPTGWLAGAGAGVGAGDLVGFRVTGDEVEVVAGAGADIPAGLGEHLRRVFDRENEGDGMPVTVIELVNGAVSELVEAGGVAPAELVLAPVGELMAQCGFEVRDDFAAPEGTDWEAFERMRAATAMARARGMGLGEARRLVMVSQLYQLFVEGKLDFGRAERELAGEVIDLLDTSEMAEAFVVLALIGPHGDQLERFVGALGASAPHWDRGWPAWMASVVAGQQDDHQRAESLLRQALEAEPEHLEALGDAAWYASDRGDAGRAVRLLDRLAALGDEEAEIRVAVMRRFTRMPASQVGRNEPCPCGSGRKHKHCCLGRAGVAPLPERVGWIWQKLDWFLSRTHFAEAVEDVIDLLGPHEEPDYLLAASLVLFQDGAVDDFLSRRGPLLPADEWNLVTQWALVDRSVHEVVAVDRGAGVTLRNIRTGDMVDVRERTGSTQAGAGDLVFAHVVPDGVGHQIVGGVLSIPLRLRDPLIAVLDSDPDAVEVAATLAAAWAPPEIRTTEGEPLVLCEARYRTGDAAAALDPLDEVLDRDDDTTWSESIPVDGRRSIRGTVSLEGDELVVSANSEARFSRLRELVEATVPGLEVAAVKTTPAHELMSKSRRRPAPAPGSPPPPEAAIALADFVRQQEQRWVDEEVPALGGLTPRQAAADPTRREQLVALLHDFDRNPAPQGAATFDTARLRATLGIDP